VLSRKRFLRQKVQSQNYFGRSAEPAPRTALGTTLGQGFVDGGKQLLIVQHVVGWPNPVFPQVADFLGNEALGEV
jgi:hypothetical protein